MGTLTLWESGRCPFPGSQRLLWGIATGLASLVFISVKFKKVHVQFHPGIKEGLLFLPATPGEILSSAQRAKEEAILLVVELKMCNYLLKTAEGLR